MWVTVKCQSELLKLHVVPECKRLSAPRGMLGGVETEINGLLLVEKEWKHFLSSDNMNY